MSRGRGYINTYADTLMRERLVKEVGAYADHFLGVGLAAPKRIHADFGIDFKTVKALRQGKGSVSFDTLRKFCYVFAFYLCKRREELELDERNILRRKDELKDLQRLLEAYKSIYGFQATFCLEQAAHQDLREIVNYEKESNRKI